MLSFRLSFVVGFAARAFASVTARSYDAALSSTLLVALDGAETRLGANQTAPIALAVQENAARINSLAHLDGDEDAYGRAKSACEILSILFGNRTISASSPAYLGLEQEPWSASVWLPAACFLQVQQPAEVVAALKVITYVQSKFAVRGRGHNPNPGFSSVDQTGVVLDLRNLNRVNVSDGAKVVSAEPGASWNDVYGKLDSYNVSAVGGRDGDVGVVGLILGGGMPYFSGLTGLACANVKGFQVILANATVVDANIDENPDLYYALKGGGPNYGVVVRADLYTVPVQRVWYTLAIYNKSDAATALAAAARLHEYARKDSRLGFFLNANPSGLFAGLLYAGWTEWPEAYEPFRNLSPAITLASNTNGTIATLAQTISGNPGAKVRRYGVSVVHRFNPALYNGTHQKYLSVANFSGSDTGGLSYTIQPVSANVAKYQARNGGSPLTVEPVDQDWIVVPVSWASSKNDADATGAAKALRADIQQRAKASGDLLDLVFMNDAASEQSPLRSYGTNVLRKLKRIARTYDPDGVFQSLQYGGFLLAEV